MRFFVASGTARAARDPLINAAPKGPAFCVEGAFPVEHGEVIEDMCVESPCKGGLLGVVALPGTMPVSASSVRMKIPVAWSCCSSRSTRGMMLNGGKA